MTWNIQPECFLSKALALVTVVYFVLGKNLVLTLAIVCSFSNGEILKNSLLFSLLTDYILTVLISK